MMLNQLISSTPLRQIHEGKYKKDEEKFVKKFIYQFDNFVKSTVYIQ